MKLGVMQKRLVLAREKAGYNRKEFAEMLEIPYRTITNYENGSREPGHEYLLKVSDVCGCSIDWILGRTDQVSPPSPCPNRLLTAYNQLNEEGQQKATEYCELLVSSGQYKKHCSAEMVDGSA